MDRTHVTISHTHYEWYTVLSFLYCHDKCHESFNFKVSQKSQAECLKSQKVHLVKDEQGKSSPSALQGKNSPHKKVN